MKRLPIMTVLSLSSCCTEVIDGMVPESEWRCSDMVVVQRDEADLSPASVCVHLLFSWRLFPSPEQEISIKRWTPLPGPTGSAPDSIPAHDT